MIEKIKVGTLKVLFMLIIPFMIIYYLIEGVFKKE